jgi:hypothetical protein
MSPNLLFGTPGPKMFMYEYGVYEWYDLVSCLGSTVVLCTHGNAYCIFRAAPSLPSVIDTYMLGKRG